MCQGASEILRVFVDRTMAVVQKMALGLGIGVMAAGVGVYLGGTRGVLAGVRSFSHRLLQHGFSYKVARPGENLCLLYNWTLLYARCGCGRCGSGLCQRTRQASIGNCEDSHKEKESDTPESHHIAEPAHF